MIVLLVFYIFLGKKTIGFSGNFPHKHETNFLSNSVQKEIQTSFKHFKTEVTTTVSGAQSTKDDFRFQF